MEEGYIKFNCHWIKTAPLSKHIIVGINAWRHNLYKQGLIGAYSNGIGYGNISIRINPNSFLITGSSTGNIKKLNENHYTLVNEYDLLQNKLTCSGPIKASSESLSHAAVYECSPDTNAVFHIHNIEMWDKLIHKCPTTRTNVQYGTPGMANEIKRLFKETDVGLNKSIIMGGHKEGIMTFGNSLDEAGRILLNMLESFKS